MVFLDNTPAAVLRACFSKRLDASTFKGTITLPVEVHEAFLKHLTVKLDPGKGSHPVTVMVGGRSFGVSIINVGFSVPRRGRVLQFHLETPLRKFFRETFPAAYHQLVEQNAGRAGIDTVFTISCGEGPDVFRFDLGGASFEGNEPAGSAPVEATDAAPPEASVPGISPFIEVLLRDFPSGFEFNDSSVQLLKSADGQPCPESVQKELKHRMFKRYDGIYLLPEMVADKETLEAIKQRIKEYFDQFHAFSLPVLYSEFAGRLNGRALTNPDSDFRLFLRDVVLPELPGKGKVFGKLQKQIGIPTSCTEQEVLDFLAERIRGILDKRGDAVPNEDLLQELPCLNADALEMIIRERIPDAVEITIDEQRYWKLLEFFYLPEEFEDGLLQVIAAIEKQKKIPSLQVIADRLAEQFGDDFRENYALEDDDVFQQVIVKSIREGKYDWSHNLLVRKEGGPATNVAEEFLQGQDGFFHVQDFCKYAAYHRRMFNSTVLVRDHLRISCIRLGQQHWIGLDDFERQSDFSAEMARIITQKLQAELAHRLFLPLGTLPDAFFSELQPLHIQERLFHWNAYMLASIVEQKLSSLRVVNTEQSPTMVTAMLIPENSDYKGDVIDFVFQALRQASMHFSSADQVFNYLRKNNIRMVRSEKLLERIKAFWGVR